MSGRTQLFDMTYDDTNKCVQCGYCLPVCPTYDSMGKESASPRGRINLVKMASEEKIDILEHALAVVLVKRLVRLACRTVRSWNRPKK